MKNYRICTKFKLRNKPYYPSTHKAKDIFYFIYLDLIGPTTESLYRNKYVLTVLDDNSRYNWTFFLKIYQSLLNHSFIGLKSLKTNSIKQSHKIGKWHRISIKQLSIFFFFFKNIRIIHQTIVL